MTGKQHPAPAQWFTVRRDPRHDRAMDLSALVRQWSGFEQTHRTAAASALLFTARRHWEGTRHLGAAILAAAEQGTLIPFVIWPSGQQPAQREDE